jgi:hypothetical protein
LRFLEWFAFTLDTHDKANPVKPFPIGREYLRLMVKLWQANPLLSIRKSRQLIMTWLFSALCLWDTLHPGRMTVQQSKRLEDAVGNEYAGDGPLGRSKFILSHIPGRKLLGLVEGGSTGYIKLATSITFPKLNSSLLAIPQGGNIIRQRTLSGIMSDESHFQDEFSDAYAGAVACIRGGGWFVSLSTANLGAALDLHEDRMGDR